MNITKLLAVIVAALHMCSVLGADTHILIAAVGLLQALIDYWTHDDSAP